MRSRLALACCLFLWMVSCAPTPTPIAPTRVTVFASAETTSWLADSFTCASKTNIKIFVTANPTEADLSLRLGEPAALTTPAFQIDTEEILVVTNRESPLQNMDLAQVRDLFANGDPSVQVWVYASGDEVQLLFDQLVMAGSPVTSSARMAATPQEMSDTLNAQANAVGILPKHWLTGNPRSIYSLGSLPVLAVTRTEPQGALKELVACLQK